ncbi:sugar/nucleoside kinase (ribokinase family) [Rhodobacter viridis]|uniref:Sugar/nucleoside kinase (Ribokinase family) n=1 Tax=Rhodobacter viridis TaxID=1054202 RepID=A0A318TQ13_9RHOB|nr:PfkB family carbohydrate kinase [Rhodobacter viridis]PYF06413.1 sugar/nucleoside kinase (ribokinase family) [Rhodobacter viridis]
MPRSGFLTAGTFVLDRNIAVDAWPQEDMAATARAVALSGGGSACNFAIDMLRLDPSVPVAVQTLVGADAEGDFLIAEAARFGIDPAGFARTDQARTQITDAYHSAATGRRTHILFPGTAPLLTPDHFDFSTTRARFLHLGLPGIHPAMDAPWGDAPNGWVAVLKRARAAGLETNLELVSTGAEALRAAILPCLPHLTTLVCNDFEIGALAGIKTVQAGVTDWDAVERAAEIVLGQGAMALVAVHFTLGAVLVERGAAPIRCPSVKVPPGANKGANGAGDAFAAGFFYGRHRGWAPRDCLRMGHATSAACLRAPGTYETIDRAEACLQLAEDWGWRD